MPRLWYPESFHVEIICHRLAEVWFTYEPLPAFQLEDAGGLESALALPRQSFGGRYFYPTWYDKAGVLLRSLIKNHPLRDGNKRLGLSTTLVFLMMNGRFLLVSNDEMVEYALQIASEHGSPPWRRIARWIREYAMTFDDAIPMLDDPAAPQELAGDIAKGKAALKHMKNWSETYRGLEARLRRACRQRGVDPRLVLPRLAKRMMSGE